MKFLRAVQQLLILVLAATALVALLSVCAVAIEDKRPIEAKDAIEMTRVASAACPSDDSAASQAGQISPDHKRFFIVLAKGNLRNNVNEYTLRVFQSKALRPGLRPRTLVTMRSADEPAIRDTCWTRDARAIFFIGAEPRGDAGIYSVSVATGIVKRLTPRGIRVLRYALTDDGRTMVYIASPHRPRPTQDTQTEAPFVVEGQSLLDLIAGDHGEKQPAFDLYRQVAGQAKRKEWKGEGADSSFLSVSPNGRFAVLCRSVRARELPKKWEDYDYGPDNAIIKTLFRTTDSDAVVPFQRYMVIDMRNHAAFWLWDGPRLAEGFQELKWLSDGRSIALHNVFPPHPSTGARDQQLDVTVDLEDRTWKPQTSVDWTPPSKSPSPFRIAIEQSLKEPPRLLTTDASTGKKTFLFDLNPQFAHLAFGAVRVVSWQVHGITVESGLYLPPDYDPKKRYPLVIQTHGFHDQQFSMDGNDEWSSAFAARLLAAKGIAVLQTYSFSDARDHDTVGNDPELGLTEEERFRTFAKLVYEGAVGELDKQAVLDVNRVGISGFSRTVWFVEYTLTHSLLPFKAALLVDGIDAGYFNYLAFQSREFEADNGGIMPFGTTGLDQWRAEAPGFNLDRVACPVRLVSLNRKDSVLLAWEWFAGLRLLQKPVELTVFPHASHILTQPTDRYLAMMGMTNWFTRLLGGPHSEEHPNRVSSPDQLR
jgi:dipeptidyl aminopeptidase/acylaminoacyl peptidase